jgi:hypothetical protein
MQRRCARCGSFEYDLREQPRGVMALVGTTYGPFVPDFEVLKRRRGALN